MFDISSVLSLRVASPVTTAIRPPVGPFPPPSLAAASRTAGAWSSADPGSPRAGMSYDGRSMEGLQRAIQAVGPSLMDSLSRGDGAFASPGDRFSGSTGTARPSTLERVSTWSGNAPRRFLGGPAQAEPPAWRTQRDVAPAKLLRSESADATRAPRVRRGADEDFLAEFHPPAGKRYVIYGDRSSPALVFLDRNVPYSQFAKVFKTVDLSLSRRAVGMTGGAQMTLDGTRGVLTRVRVALPPNAATLTVKVSREGDVSPSERWSPSYGIGGVSATIVSDNPKKRIQNILNLRPIEPLTARLGGSIPVDGGRVDGKRFVTVEVLASREGGPIRLEIASEPAGTAGASKPPPADLKPAGASKPPPADLKPAGAGKPQPAGAKPAGASKPKPADPKPFDVNKPYEFDAADHAFVLEFGSRPAARPGPG